MLVNGGNVFFCCDEEIARKLSSISFVTIYIEEIMRYFRDEIKNKKLIYEMLQINL